MAEALRIGTAGWTIPRTVAGAFPAEGSGLARYAARLDAAEINTSFYRSHRPATWVGWREATPEGFRFAVKAPKAVTHTARLVDCDLAMAAFLGEVSALGDKLGPVLVQLPPSLAFDAVLAEAFFGGLRVLFEGSVACEPRHVSWFEADADGLLAAHRVARVAADPARHPLAGQPGGWRGLAYWRLHGSPVMYRSSYGREVLEGLAREMAESEAQEAWCIFDNTTLGAAAGNALELASLVRR